ncbi:MAG: hypothetical protein PUF37_01810 [Prevotellaceae bacterium]|nr:hypothetical protein [Prevotellaceae bacterium]
MMKLKSRFFSLVAFGLLLSSCGQDPISRYYPTRLYVDLSTHIGTLLETAVSSPGTNVKATLKSYNGAVQVVTTSSTGKSETITLSDVEKRYTVGSSNIFYLGANNDVILCYSSWSQQPVAWDAQCPNCVSTNINSPLSWSTTSSNEVVCPKCYRTYNLWTGAITSGSDGDPLMRYIVSYAAGRTLTVGN